jgi:hypothetical protein
MSELGFRNNARTGNRFSLECQAAGCSFPYGELPENPETGPGRLVLPMRDNRPVDVRPDYAVIAS